MTQSLAIILYGFLMAIAGFIGGWQYRGIYNDVTAWWAARRTREGEP